MSIFSWLLKTSLLILIVMLTVQISAYTTLAQSISKKSAQELEKSFHKALLNEDFETVKKIMSSNIDVNNKGEDGFTLLMRAVDSSSHKKTEVMEVINLLIKAGADVNAKNDWTDTAIMLVHYPYEAEKIKLLVDAGADINSKDKKGQTALMRTVYSHDKRKAKALLISGADIFIKDNYGVSPYLYVFTFDHPDHIKPIVNEFKDIFEPQLQKAQQVENIWNAAATNNIEGLRKLLKTGLSVNTKDINGDTPLNFAVRNGQIKTVKFLLDSGADLTQTDIAGRNVLMLAINENQLEVVKLLLTTNININAKSKDENTALIYACDNKNVEIVKLLLAAGAQVNIYSKNSSALAQAVLYNEKQIVELLLAAGADVNAKYPGNRTILIESIRGDENIVKQILAAGADINARDKQGLTALSWAVLLNKKENAQVLIEAGADVNVRDYSSATPLMTAAYYGYTEMAKLLLIAGADPTLKSMGYTAYDFAVMKNHKEIMTLLEKTK